MTIDETIKYLQQKKKDGIPGETLVCWDSLERTWPITAIVTERSGKRIILVNA